MVSLKAPEKPRQFFEFEIQKILKVISKLLSFYFESKMLSNFESILHFKIPYFSRLKFPNLSVYF